MRSLRIKHISDIHSDRWDLESLLRDDYDPNPDLVICTGDMVHNFVPIVARMNFPEAAEEEKRKQRIFWEEQVEILHATYPEAEIVAVPGNHDFFNMAIPGVVESFDTPEPRVIEACGVRIAGFRGVPWFNGSWDGELSENALKTILSLLDKSAQILVTHTPPWGILDAVTGSWTPELPEPEPRHTGMKGLAGWTQVGCRVKLHCFGHIHESRGVHKEWGVTYSNASLGIVNHVIDF